MDCFGKFRDYISKPKKIESYSLFEYGEVLKRGSNNQVFINDKILENEKIDIQLDKDIDQYIHNLEECKVVLRSKMLMDLCRDCNNNLMNRLNGGEFFLSRETMCNLGNVYGCSKTTSWAIIINGVIVIVKEYNKDKNIYKNIESSYYDHYFANVITSKDGLSDLNYNKRVGNLNSYYEISTIDISTPNKKVFRVGNYYKVDGFDKKTKLPVKIETQHISPLSQRFLNIPKLASLYFKCILSDVQTIVVGYKKSNSIYEVKKYQITSLMDSEYYGDVVRCCENIYKKFGEIKELFNQNNNKGCIRIQRDVGINVIRLNYFNEIQPEVKRLFTDEFCKTFF